MPKWWGDLVDDGPADLAGGFVRTSLRELAEGGPGAPNRSPRDLARRAAEEQA